MAKYKGVIVVLIALTATKIMADEYESCGDSLECVEANLVKAVDKIDSEKTISFLDDALVIEKTKEVDVGRKKEDLFDRLMRYLGSHEVKLRMPEISAREVEARRRKWRRFLLPLILILKLKAAILVPAVLIVLGFTAVKALASSFLVLGFTIGSALRGLSDYHPVPHKISYEVVPQVSAHLWNRAGMDNFPLEHGYHTIS